jgi:hypothetical protein
MALRAASATEKRSTCSTLTFELAVVFNPAEVLGGGVGKGRAGFGHARERAATRLVEDVAQPALGHGLCEVARLRAAAGGPGEAHSSLALAAIREAVLGVPDGAARTHATEHVAARQRCDQGFFGAHSVGIYPSLGTKSGRSFGGETGLEKRD